jgi:hypothetical protein
MNNTIFHKAKTIALSQGQLGDSPASWHEGRLNLCAASCIAKAAIELNGLESDTRDFSIEIMREGCQDFIDGIFQANGLAIDARSVMHKNDSTPKLNRLNWFLGLHDNQTPS